MKLRLAGPAHAMPVRRRDEPIRSQLDTAATATPDAARLPLEIADRRVHCLLVRVDQRARGLRVADREQHTHALWRRERQVKCAHPIPPRPGPQHLPAAGVAAGDQRAERFSVGLALQSEAAAPVPTQRPSASPRPA